MNADDYPNWICKPCGERYGRRPVGIATWHLDDCGVCGAVRVDCTEPRDFGHLRDDWRDHKQTGAKVWEPN